MLKSRSILLMSFIGFSLWAIDASAQTPTDSLGGKTVHVYLPCPGIDTLVIQNVNARMAKDAPNWYAYTFTRAGLYDYPDGFNFTNPSHRRFFPNPD